MVENSDASVRGEQSSSRVNFKENTKALVWKHLVLRQTMMIDPAH